MSEQGHGEEGGKKINEARAERLMRKPLWNESAKKTEAEKAIGPSRLDI